jgi:hypothetical protein
MRVDRDSKDQVYAYGTSVTVSQTLEEIRHVLGKYHAEGFAHVVNPFKGGGIYIAFIASTRVGKLPVRVEVPQVFYKGQYLERESYRALFLIIKSKFTQIECGEPAELVFLPNVPSNQREKLLPHVDDLPMLEEKSS